MEDRSATNLTEVAADSVSLWNATSKRWVDVRDSFVEKAQITSPVEVVVPIMDEIDTFLAYPNANSKRCPPSAESSRTSRSRSSEELRA